jgi:hypothetical protein
VRGDGLDAAGHARDQLDGVVRAVHHGRRCDRAGPPPRREVAAVVVVWERRKRWEVEVGVESDRRDRSRTLARERERESR